MLKIRTVCWIVAAIAGVTLIARAASAADATPVRRAAAVLHATEGNNVRGTVVFTTVENGVRVVADVTGLAPGPHGFHVHQFGDCSAKNGKSAGGHFNPQDMPHAGPSSARRHVGDLGNIVADEDGRATMDAVDTKLSLNGSTSVIGRGVIVHGGADDLKSQPSGAAGPRVACGTIGIASP